MTEFSLQRSRRYWRHVPSGAGKHDTEELLACSDDELVAVWHDAFERRLSVYPDEKAFLLKTASQVKGKRILSIGSGFGFLELWYAAHGASVTCCDIVPSNLATIRRVAAIKGCEVTTTVIDDANDPEYVVDGRFDVVAFYGSLMTMPEKQQQRALERARTLLEDDGCLHLMLYTFHFAAETCGWDNPDQFDPQVFARMSDPSVADEDCPWSDWHDDEKVLRLAGNGGCITQRQTWNDERYVWYSLAFEQPAPASPELFFEPRDREEAVVQRIDLEDFEPADAEFSRQSSCLDIGTNASEAAYAAISVPLDLAAGNCLVAEVELTSGGVSVGLLDTNANRFVVTAASRRPGRHRLELPFRHCPVGAQIVLSNHRPGDPGTSQFRVHEMSVVEAVRIDVERLTDS